MVKWEKLQGKDTANDPLHRWLAYFDKNSPPELVKKDLSQRHKKSPQTGGFF